MVERWPNEHHIAPYKKPSSLKSIESIFYNTGIVVSTLYILIHLTLSPLLLKLFDQRIELHHDTLMRLRRVVNGLRARIKTTHLSALGENQRIVLENKVYVDRCQQTNEELPGGNTPEDWTRINTRLLSMVEYLREYTTAAVAPSVMESIEFQAKLITDQMNEPSLKIKKQQEIAKSIQSIREMKGWFIHGKVPQI